MIFAQPRGMRGDLTDEAWGIIGEGLPAERWRGCRPSHGNRRIINSMHGQERPLGFKLTCGEVSDYQAVEDLNRHSAHAADRQEP